MKHAILKDENATVRCCSINSESKVRFTFHDVPVSKVNKLNYPMKILRYTLVQFLPEGHQRSPIQVPLCSGQVNNIHGPASHIRVQLCFIPLQVESAN